MSTSACLQEVPEAVGDRKAAAKRAQQDQGSEAALLQANAVTGLQRLRHTA